MKLNPNCVRDILIQLENDLDFPNSIQYRITDENRILPQYDWYEIVYHIRQCDLYGFITGVHFYGNYDSFTVNDILPKGHEFLANIRQDKIWKKIMQRALNVGSIALPVIQQIAATYFQQKI